MAEEKGDMMQEAASAASARRIMNRPDDEYDLVAEIIRRGRERGGFTEKEMQVLEAEGVLDQIRPFEDEVIPPEPPEEYWEALDRDEVLKEEARRRFNRIQFGEEEPPAPGIPFRWEHRGFSEEDLPVFKKKYGYPSAKFYDRGDQPLFSNWASKRLT